MSDEQGHLVARDFDAFVETIAENNRERDGSCPTVVAKTCIVHYQEVRTDDGFEPTFRFDATPYYDERVWPDDVIRYRHDSEYAPSELPGIASGRHFDVAQEILRQAIAKYYDDCADGWTQFDPETGEPCGTIENSGVRT